jgi:hypothetical protein
MTNMERNLFGEMSKLVQLSDVISWFEFLSNILGQKKFTGFIFGVRFHI